jgi:carotenoid cleavage dioxygenase-like enzyme
MTTTTTNRYLRGNYAPVSEEVTAYDLPVIGELPVELEGRYLRNGPNPLKPPDDASHHWFMGDGMVHARSPPPWRQGRVVPQSVRWQHVAVGDAGSA